MHAIRGLFVVNKIASKCHVPLQGHMSAFPLFAEA